MSVPITTRQGTIALGRATPLFRIEFDNAFQTRQQYAASSDGRRFLVNASVGVEPPAMTIVLNWNGTP